jgi:hypothetical protein
LIIIKEPGYKHRRNSTQLILGSLHVAEKK